MGIRWTYPARLAMLQFWNHDNQAGVGLRQPTTKSSTGYKPALEQRYSLNRPAGCGRFTAPENSGVTAPAVDDPLAQDDVVAGHQREREVFWQT